MREAVRVQVRIKIITSEGDRVYHERGRDQILFDWAATGKTPEGIEIESVTWHNYDRRVSERTAKSDEEIERARTSLHLAELFSAKAPSFSQMGPSKGTSKPSKPATRHRRRKMSLRKASRKSGAKARARKSRKHRAHRESRNRMASHRTKQQRKGMAHRRANQKKPDSSRAGSRTSYRGKRSGARKT